MSDHDSVKRTREQAQTFLADVLRLMGFEARVEAFDLPDNEVLLHIESADAGRLIGRDAQGLAALQLVLNRMVWRSPERTGRFIVDVERYRERRKDRLLNMALNAAEQVRQTGHAVKLAPMNAADRRIIHHAIMNQKDLRTWSEVLDGEHEKCVVVDKAEPSVGSDSPPGNHIQ